MTFKLTPAEMLNNATDAKVSIHEIYFDPTAQGRNPEKYTADNIELLAGSIKQAGGLLNPLLLVAIQPDEATNNKSYALVAGGRRYSALMLLDAEGLTDLTHHVPARIVKCSAEMQQEHYRSLQLLENIREEQTPIEKARAFQDAKAEGMTQKDLAEFLGVPEGTVSQYLAMLKQSKELMDALEDESLSFSAARLITSKVPIEQQPHVVKIAVSKTYGQFKKYMDENYGDKKGSDDSSESQPSTQKTRNIIQANTLNKYFLPFAAKKKEQADGTEKKFTEKDLYEAVEAALKAVGTQQTSFTKAMEPFVTEVDRKEAEAKASEESLKKETDFFESAVKEVNKLMDLPVNPETLTRPYPDVATAAAAQVSIIKNKYSENAEALASLGFKLDLSEQSLATNLMKAWEEDNKRKLEAKRRREEKKAKEEAEKKAKEEAEKSGTASTEEATQAS